MMLPILYNRRSPAVSGQEKSVCRENCLKIREFDLPPPSAAESKHFADYRGFQIGGWRGILTRSASEAIEAGILADDSG